MSACTRPRSQETTDDDAQALDRAHEPEADGEARRAELLHRVVFADRTSHSYLLLLPPGATKQPSREELRNMVRETFPLGATDPEQREEVDRLLDLIATEPDKPLAGPTDLDAAIRTGERRGDLLGFHIDVLERAGEHTTQALSNEVLEHPVLTRTLTSAERSSLPSRKSALILRADYRNQHAFRGLRLLQALVRVVANHDNALIHDPDTRETMGVVAFAARRLQASLGNVADQVVVVPFADRRHGEGFMRLSTRGMRRFGSPDLELDGLPTDPETLQQATHLVYGIATKLVSLAELDRTGLATLVPETVSVHWQDIARAYSGRAETVPRCKTCPEETSVHLVERPSEPHDPHGHVVARIVAPRSQSDRPDYDHSAWAGVAMAQVLGPK